MTANRIRMAVREFTTHPGPRKRADATDSGEQFLQDFLLPRFREAQKAHAILTVDLDGVAGYPTSFLEEAFGGLAREFGPELVAENLEFVCDDEPYLNDEIRDYIRDARQ